MKAPSAGDTALACMAQLADELHRHGVRDACVSPGSRSTPLVLALARHGGFRLHVHLDERAAAFFALGLARGQARPVAVAATSGTAVANWLPAAVEASHSRVPLLLLSADRPPELRGTGANQTIDQVGIFGRSARWSVDAPVPEAGPDAARRWRSLAARAVRRSLSPVPGPVHVNLPFREPLVPTGAPVELGPAAAGRPAGAPWWRARATSPPPDPSDVRRLVELVRGSERGLVVAGGLDGGPEARAAITRLAEIAGWPLLAEPLSGLRTGSPALSCGSLLAGSETWASQHLPEVVVQLGATPTARGVLGLAARARRLAVVTAPGAEADPARAASLTVRCDPAGLAGAVAAGVERARPDSAWLRDWHAADLRVADAVGAWMASLGEEPFEGRVARDAAACLPDGALLFAGSSMPVRNLDSFMLPRSGLRVIGNRGASGIDGSVSTVLGLAATGAPVCGVIGDLSLLHDAGALLWSGSRAGSAVLVVINNGGGGIFHLLPGTATLPERDSLFSTVHHLDLGALVRAAGARHRLVERASELEPAVRASLDAGGIAVVEVRADRLRNVERHAACAAAVERALSAPQPRG